MPWTSKLLTPPSRFNVTFSFSSTLKVMGSVGGGAAARDWESFGWTSSRMTSPSAFNDSKNWFVLWDLPSFIPRPFGGAVAAEVGRPKQEVNGVDKWKGYSHLTNVNSGYIYIRVNHNQDTACFNTLLSHYIKSILKGFKKTYEIQPLGLVEKESTSEANPKPEPLPKPVPLLDILKSLKLFSILPEPIDCNGPNPPLSPLFFSICRTHDLNKWYAIPGFKYKHHHKTYILQSYLAFINLTSFSLHNILSFINLALQNQLV